jgi:zinc D-Ala-D-Ala carboxypeptidase
MIRCAVSALLAGAGSVVVVVALLVGCDRGRPGGATDAARDARPRPIDAAAPDAPPPRPRLAWVNPARCASPCTFDPAATLVRIDRDGQLAATGAHGVAPAVVAPLGQLIAAAGAAGHRLRVESAYRSYDEQTELFRTTRQVGRAARPGHSEHQLGTAIDLDLPTKHAVAWLAEHALDHGFVVSYPPGKHRITGYRPEPWHVRYVGDDLAAQLRRAGGTLEELLRARPELGVSGACDDCPSDASRAACGAVTAAGRCAGDVLEWCYDGALAAVHCGALRARCGASADTGQHDCVP